jgi:hypothetical protein
VNIASNSQTLPEKYDAPRPDPLAHVSNLGHTGDAKPIIFHPTALEFIRGEDPTIRREIMATSKARKLVTVRTAEGLGRVLGLSTADTAEMEFRSSLTVSLARSFNPDASRTQKSPNVPERQEPE